MRDGRVQLHIKFGGKFEGNPFHIYIDGDICYSRVIPYEFSYVDLVSVMQEIGCHPWRSFLYLRPGHGIENVLSEITSDVDMTKMCILYEGEDKDIECFVTHLDVEEDDEEGLGWEGVELGTIGARKTVETSATRGRGVARGRGLAVSATIVGASAVGTGGARATRSTTFDDVRAIQTVGARIDRYGATRTGGTTGGAKTIEAGTMIRHGKKIYLKSADRDDIFNCETELIVFFQIRSVLYIGAIVFYKEDEIAKIYGSFSSHFVVLVVHPHLSPPLSIPSACTMEILSLAVCGAI
ncbi:hypothetical protein RHGRI_026114 [Rhododendron griersonianum]|uniref:PB1-like domain-containing protein n=1 Tax=Rhododendron griersonianum TaxID=479676 RepID=A0AAV6ISH9_9ERIC|nr:hypothetical protein RHGRI_026114 [Rhododendron griersonianum]